MLNKYRSKHTFELDHIKNNIKELTTKLKLKAERKEIMRFHSDMKRFALYEDFKDLHNKTLLPM